MQISKNNLALFYYKMFNIRVFFKFIYCKCINKSMHLYDIKNRPGRATTDNFQLSIHNFQTISNF